MIFKRSAKSDIVRLTKNFYASEMVCKCGQCDPQQLDLEGLVKLQKTRDANKLPMHIRSAFRCKNHNFKSGGKPGSAHLTGSAWDCSSQGRTPLELARIGLIYGKFTNIGLAKDFVHFDNRAWAGRLRLWTYGGAELTDLQFREYMEGEWESCHNMESRKLRMLWNFCFRYIRAISQLWKTAKSAFWTSRA